MHCKTYEQAEKLKTKLEERFRECGLELHPLKTKIIYCKDENRKGEFKEISFDFLGFTFRQRRSMNRYTRKVTANFLPAISNNSVKSIKGTIRTWRLTIKVDKSIEALAAAINPIIRGWNNYYGKFYSSELAKFHMYLNAKLKKWASNKYSKLWRHKKRTAKWLENVAKQRPKLFAHWEIGVIPFG